MATANKTCEDEHIDRDDEDGSGSLLALAIGPRPTVRRSEVECTETIDDWWHSLGRGQAPPIAAVDWASLAERYDDVLVLRCSNPEQGTIWEIATIGERLKDHPILSANDQYSLFAEWLIDLGRLASRAGQKITVSEAFTVGDNSEIEILATVFPFGRPAVTHVVCQLSDRSMIS